MNGKFIGYFRLIEACGQGGCPICRCLEGDGRRHLDALLYEQVTDPGTRRRLRATWGFCNWHASMLLEVRNAVGSAAILCEDVLGTILRRLERLRDRAGRGARGASWLARLPGVRSRSRPAVARLYRRRPPCPVCAASVDAEERYIAAMLRFVDDPQFARAYGQSAGLCVPHLLQAIERGAGTPAVASLLDRTLPKWRDLDRDLERFIAKHDYRNRQPFTEAEAAAPRGAIELLSGRPGLYGNDLHAGLGPLRAEMASLRPDAARDA
jgi:hypothetical protein